MESTPVTRALDGLGLAYSLHRHQGPVRSLEQAACERGLEPDQIVRSLVFRLEDDSFVMLLMPGPRAAAWPKLRRHLGVQRMTTATAEEVVRATGYEPGAVSPLGLAVPMRIVADRSLLNPEVISLGAGVHNAGVILRRDDLLRALEIEVGDFAA